MKTILVPIDFSEQSVQALEHAIGLSNYMQSDIKLVHVIKTYLHYHPIFGLKVEAPDIDFISDKMKVLVEKYSPLTDRQIEYSIRVGKVYSEICNEATSIDATLISMGSHGLSGFDDRWVGSNTLRVVSLSPCPVLTIRKDCPLSKYKRILLPIDSSGESRQKVPFVAQLASDLGCEVFLLMVAEKSESFTSSQFEEISEQVLDYFVKKGIACSKEVKSGMDLAANTIEYARKNKIDLITIMTERFENQMNSWIGPYASQIINHSPIPVLNFNPL